MCDTRHIEQLFEKYYKKSFEDITENDIARSFSKVITDPSDEELENYVDKRIKEYSMKLADKLVEYPVMERAFESYDGIVEFMGLSEEEANAVIEKFDFKQRFRDGYRKGTVLAACKWWLRIVNSERNDEQTKAYVLGVILDKSEEEGKEWVQNIDKHIILELLVNGFQRWEIMFHLDYMTEEIYEANKPSLEEIDKYEPVTQAEDPTDEEVEEAYREYLSEKEKAE